MRTTDSKWLAEPAWISRPSALPPLDLGYLIFCTTAASAGVSFVFSQAVMVIWALSTGGDFSFWGFPIMFSMAAAVLSGTVAAILAFPLWLVFRRYRFDKSIMFYSIWFSLAAAAANYGAIVPMTHSWWLGLWLIPVGLAGGAVVVVLFGRERKSSAS